MGLAFMGGGAFYLGWNLFSGEIEAQAASRLDQAKKKTTNGLLKISKPVFYALVFPYSQKIKADDWKKKQRRMIISAGLEEEIDAEELLAYKIFLGIIVPLAIYVYFMVNGGRTLSPQNHGADAGEFHAGGWFFAGFCGEGHDVRRSRRSVSRDPDGSSESDRHCAEGGRGSTGSTGSRWSARRSRPAGRGTVTGHAADDGCADPRVESGDSDACPIG
jgi:hypothetical protein